MHYFKNNGDVFGFELADPRQCIAALARINPLLHADRIATQQASESWRMAVYALENWGKQKQQHDEWAAHKAAYDAWVAADRPDSSPVPAPGPEPIRPSDNRPPEPGPQPPELPALTAEDVLTNLTDGWFDVTGNWPPPPSLGDARKAAKSVIESAFANALAPYVPRMPGYELREAQASIYKAAGYTGDVPSQVASFQVAAGLTPTAATDTILAQAAAFRAALNELETRRMRKFEVDAMTDARAIEAKAAQIAGEIKAIAAML